MSKSKDLVVQVSIKWDDLAGKDDLDMFRLFSERSEDAIKRKVVDEVVKRIIDELPTPEIDMSDLKERIKQAIVERKLDEVLGQ